MRYKENELYQEIEIFDNFGTKVGEAEVDIKGKMLSRLTIFEPFRGRGYGEKTVGDLTNRFGLDVLWVNADNDIAINLYRKCGYHIAEPTMYKMVRSFREKV